MAAVLSPSSPISAAALYTKLRWPSGVRTAFDRNRWSPARAATRRATAGSVEVEAVVADEHGEPGAVAAAHLEPVEGGERLLDRRADLDGRPGRLGPHQLAHAARRWEAGRARPPTARPSGGAGPRWHPRACARPARPSASSWRLGGADPVVHRRRRRPRCAWRRRGRARAGRRRRWCGAGRRAPRAARRPPRRPQRDRRPSSARWTALSGSRTSAGSRATRAPGPRRRAMMPHTHRSLPVSSAGPEGLDGRRPGGRAAASAAPAVGASTITRTSGSVPLPRTRTRPWSPSSASHRRDLRRPAAPARSMPLSATPTLCSTCGSRVMAASASSPSGSPGAVHGVEQLHGGEEAVAGGGEVGEDDVPALLAAERQALVGQRLEHVAVADGHLEDLDAVLAHARAGSRGWPSRWRRPCPSASRPWSRRSMAVMAMIWSPSMSRPSASTASTRSASPSNASPASAPRWITAFCRSSG